MISQSEIEELIAEQQADLAAQEKSESDGWGYDGENETYQITTYFQEVCFDDPQMQSHKTEFSLILGRD
jgi:hypothetical protein